ncbi:MAG: hypothetical protein JWR15_994, partial [Prosthecobacter sp.]|nr:hypothetical protein [Prosthecobacter sp.]
GSSSSNYQHSNSNYQHPSSNYQPSSHRDHDNDRDHRDNDRDRDHRSDSNSRYDGRSQTQGSNWFSPQSQQR